MATLFFSAAGSAIGSVFGPIGAMIGQAAGAAIGSTIDRSIMNALTPAQRREGPRLTTSNIQTSTEGSVIERLYGRARLTGQIIWATRFEEVVSTEEVGGKATAPAASMTSYSYFGNFAVGLCEGPIAGIGRIWADGVEMDQTDLEIRLHRGTETQEPDPLIEAKEGLAPAYRGLAYLVFERLALEDYGNRLPQISVEVFRPTGTLEELVPGVAIIGGNEFGYDTVAVTVEADDGGLSENRHTLVGATDWTVSIDRLAMLLPNAKSAMLVVPWFGDDLRAGDCTIRPKVDDPDKNTKPYAWSVGPLARATAEVTGEHEGVRAYGGTPADISVIRAIRDLTARGIAVTLCPFVMMDIATDNALPDPYSDSAAAIGQAAYPWRGRITCAPAPGQAGTVDKTATAAAQVASFVGTVSPSHFGGSGDTVLYSGPAGEWSYRRMVLHCAQLARLAGGVDTMLIGSEMVGLTQVRSGAAAYPFVTALKALAADVARMLGGQTAIGYAADWSEYAGHRPADGSGDVFFHLDPLWADPHIAFVGIDNYFPLADWRDGSAHLDFDPAGPTTIYDRAYLQAQIEGGEGFDWYYANAEDRAQQRRTPIIDSAKGEHWVFRAKDIRAWWSNPHYNRPGGVESATPTAWQPQAKPIRFIEMGCPAVDKGANQPNVFIDPKSSESATPYFSTGARDDAMQRAYLEALIAYYREPANNPLSSAYGGRMLDLTRSHVWCWDARPWPSFDLDPAWGDAPNWFRGHWLPGRVGTAPAPETIAAILASCGFSDHQIEPIPTMIDGMTTGTLASPRAALEALQPVYAFDAVESGGLIRFVARFGRAPVAMIDADDLVLDGEEAQLFQETRAQETDLPLAVKMAYGDPARDDQSAGTEARLAASGSARTVALAPPVIMPESAARTACERALHAAWTARERIRFALPPSLLRLEPSDVVHFVPTRKLVQLTDVTDGTARTLEGARVEPMAFAPLAISHSLGKAPVRTRHLQAKTVFIDGPLLQDGDRDHAGYVGGVMLPLRKGIALYRAPGESGFVLDGVLTMAATMGVTTAPLHAGPLWRWDRGNSLSVRLVRGTLSSHSDAVVFGGANALLVENQDGEWELLQFADATATGERTYSLTRLLRGQRGSEHAMRDPVPSGARVIVANTALRQTGISADMLGLALNWRAGPAGSALGGDDYVAQTVTLRGKARRPLAPVHLRSVQLSNGDWRLSWIRRTRIGGDSWDQADVPLGEEREAYEVEILDSLDGHVRRLVRAIDGPGLTYTVAQQAADFGAAQAGLSWRVYQMSATFGRGMPGSS